jgi:aconitate hydratase
VRRVVFGPTADEAELATLAEALAARGRHPQVEVIVAVGSARVRDSLEASGAWAALEAAGVVVPSPDLPLELTWGPSPGAWLCCGVTGAARGALPSSTWLVSAPSAIAASITGVVTDPREAGIAVPADEPERFRAPARPEGRIGPRLEDETVAERRLPAMRAMRAVVWAVVGDDCAATRVMPRGVRARREATEPARAFAWLFPGVSRSEDAVSSRSGLVIAGRAFLAGPQADEAAWALAHAGVRAVAAESYGAGGDRALASAGVLPLVVSERRTRDRLGPGDEVEIPGLPEGLEPGRPVVVRNLTRGLQVAARHPLDARAADVWRAGGVTGYAAMRARAVRQEG